jgi:acyl-coenzyme A thioesterase PaaI-like protein
MPETMEEVNEALRAIWAGEPGAVYPPPIHQRLGFRWTEYEPKRQLIATAVFPAEMAGPYATVENGAALSAVESVGLALACLLAHKRCITLTLESTFLRQLNVDGGLVTIETQIRATRKSVVYIEAVLRGADRHPALYASATYVALKSGS